MSTLERTIAIIFEGDDQSKGAFSSVTAGLNTLESAVTSVTSPLARLADDVLKLEGTFGLLATGTMVLAVQRAGEFSTATSEVGTLISDTTFDMGEYRTAILDYAQSSTQSISSITGALYSAVSAGVAWEDSIKAVSAAEQLAVAGKAELKDTTVLLVSTLNAYGASMDEAERYSDALFQTVKLGQTTIPELSASLANVSTIAGSAKIPIETLGAAIADLTAKGMSTEIAITSLRQIIASIISPTSEAMNAAKALRIEFGYSALQSKGLETVLWDVYTATGGNVEKISKLFGNVRALTGVLAMFGADGGDAFLNKLTQMRDAGGSTGEAYAKMVDEINNVNQRLINNMETTFIKFGLLIQDEAIAGIKSLTEVFKSLNTAIDAGTFDPIINVIKEFLTELITYIEDIAEVLPQALANVNWDGFTASLENVAAQVKDLFKAIFPEDLTTVEGLESAIQKVVDAFTTLNNITAGILKAWEPVFNAIGYLITELGKADSTVSQFATRIGEMLGGAQVIDALIDKFGLLGGVAVKGFIDALDDTNYTMHDVILSMHDLDTEAADTSATLGTKLVDALGRYVQSAKEGEETTAGLGKAIEDLTQEDLELYVDVKAELDRVKLHQELETLTSETRFIGIIPKLDMQAVLDADKDLDASFPMEIETHIMPTVDKASADDVKKTTEELTKTRIAQIEWSTKLEIAKVEADAEVAVEKLKLLGEGIEWSVKLDIAEVEANAQIVTAAFSTLASAFDSSGQIISSAIDAYSQTTNAAFDISGKRDFLEDVIKEELALRERAMNITADLIYTQIEYMNQKIQQMQRGEALIQIDGAGLQPHLEAFMWEILSAIQVRVNEEGHAMLFGM